jgi:hypothetical protein
VRRAKSTRPDVRTVAPKYPYCWHCSGKLWGNRYRTAVIDGHERVLHAACADELKRNPEAVAQ